MDKKTQDALLRREMLDWLSNRGVEVPKCFVGDTFWLASLVMVQVNKEWKEARK